MQNPDGSWRKVGDVKSLEITSTVEFVPIKKGFYTCPGCIDPYFCNHVEDCVRATVKGLLA